MSSAAPPNNKQISSLADVVLSTTCKEKQKREMNSTHLEHVPDSMKANFDDIRTEQAIILHDNLELHERYRLHFRVKFKDKKTD